MKGYKIYILKITITVQHLGSLWQLYIKKFNSQTICVIEVKLAIINSYLQKMNTSCKIFIQFTVTVKYDVWSKNTTYTYISRGGLWSLVQGGLFTLIEITTMFKSPSIC